MEAINLIAIQPRARQTVATVTKSVSGPPKTAAMPDLFQENRKEKNMAYIYL